MEQGMIRAARILGLAALIAIAAWLYLVVGAPIEKDQGLPQKIFYAHVPSWAGAYLGFFMTAAGGIGYLSTRKEKWDRFALCAAEVGVLFCTIGLLTGPIWAKPVWNVWWVWDARLGSTLFLWFVYVAYLFLRAFAHGSDPARTFASIYGILGTLLIPVVYYAVELAGGATMHPRNPMAEGMDPGFWPPLLASLVAYLLVFFYALGRRMEVAVLESRVEEAEWAG